MEISVFDYSDLNAGIDQSELVRYTQVFTN